MIRPRGKSEAPHMIAAYRAMQMALEALEEGIDSTWLKDKAAIDALRGALNTRSSSTHSDAEYSEVVQPQDNLNCKSVQARLATSWGYVKAQPQGEWVDLTDAEIALAVG